jgi:hypothetical protein
VTTWRQLLVFAVVSGTVQAVVVMTWIVTTDWINDRRAWRRWRKDTRRDRGER